MNKHRLGVTLFLTSILVFTLSACGGTATEEAAPSEDVATSVVIPEEAAPSEDVGTSVAMIMPGSINDGGWNTLAYNGLVVLDEEGYKTAFTENVEPANIAATARGYADDGYDLIIGHGWQFSTAFIEVAPEYPDINFFVMTLPPEDLSTVPENLQFYDPTWQYSGYMAGALAGLVSESGKVGFVGGGDNPTQRMVGNAFAQGAEDVAPDTEAFSIITGDYNDAAKGREAALTMIGNGADVIWHAADITGLGVITGVVEGGGLVIGMYSDQTGMAYNNFASSIYQDLGYVVVNRAAATHDGNFRDDGPVWLIPLRDAFYFTAGGRDTPFVSVNVPADIQEQVLAIYDDLADGKIDVTTNTE